MLDAIQVLPGKELPLGLDIQTDTANFAVFSSSCEQMILGLFHEERHRSIPMRRSGDIWHLALRGVPKGTSYAYQCGNIPGWLADPYTKLCDGKIRAKVELAPPFDWQGVEAPQIAPEDVIIYEMHVRGFTKHASSKVTYPGSYLGVIEKIPYLKQLGVNAVELMPVFEFDNTHLKVPPLINYWGYNPTHFFAPQQWLAHTDPVAEFKTMVRELHRHGILVFLDVVYNHTGEGKETDYLVNFRGLDNAVYYMLSEHGRYHDFTGCGNTLNVNHPVVQNLILDSLHYWSEQMGVDGFRFDLASIFTRGTNGKPMSHAPILEKIVQDPILKQRWLIAEAWDAVGLYQLGAFAKLGPFSEWNDRYRDAVRKFIKGTDGQAGGFAEAICGSERLYKSRSPLSSINFITAHDGFSLRDLVTYQQKHNEANGEHNRDGQNQNYNWNCGAEGISFDPHILALREKQMRNFLLALFLSQGTPMLLMGDEYGHTRHGNNNPYVQDNEINWFLWAEQNSKSVQFVQNLIAFRKQHSVLRHTKFLTQEEIIWHTDWNSRSVAFQLGALYIVFHADFRTGSYPLPNGSWRLVVDTQQDWIFHKNGPSISSMEMSPYSAFVAINTS